MNESRLFGPLFVIIVAGFWIWLIGSMLVSLGAERSLRADRANGFPPYPERETLITRIFGWSGLVLGVLVMTLIGGVLISDILTPTYRELLTPHLPKIDAINDRLSKATQVLQDERITKSFCRRSLDPLPFHDRFGKSESNIEVMPVARILQLGNSLKFPNTVLPESSLGELLALRSGTSIYYKPDRKIRTNARRMFERALRLRYLVLYRLTEIPKENTKKEPVQFDGILLELATGERICDITLLVQDAYDLRGALSFKLKEITGTGGSLSF